MAAERDDGTLTLFDPRPAGVPSPGAAAPAARERSAPPGRLDGSGGQPRTEDRRRAIDEATVRWSGNVAVVDHGPPRLPMPSGSPMDRHRSTAPTRRRGSYPLPRDPAAPRGRSAPAGRVRRRDRGDGMVTLEVTLSPEDAEQLLKVLRAHPAHRTRSTRA
ncbi:MAG: hypothetical protein S0880_32415 [Actinomycetota bacterium]|nr:hypothetical protein [Actinomycetota bacterium]